MANSTMRPVSVPSRSRSTPRRAHWQALLAACRRSGLSQAEFCRRRGIPPGTLAFWKHTLTRSAGAAHPGRATTPTFVPVRVIAAPRPIAHASAAEVSTEGSVIEIILDRGRQIRIRGPVDVAWLGQVVRMLERLGC